jgi:hypothetical protein
MSERDYFQQADDLRLEYMHRRYYETASVELLYNALTLANPDGSVKQPTSNQGRQTVELIPAPKEYCNENGEISLSWEGICIIIYHEDEADLSKKGELQATIQLVQAVYASDGEGKPPSLEFMEEFNIYLKHNTYRIEKTNYLMDYDDLADPVIKYQIIEPVGIEDITELNNMICEARVRPVDF